MPPKRRPSYAVVQYIPRKDVDMPLLERTDHQTYCPCKGDCTYYSIPLGGERSVNAVWTYEAPYAAVAAIKDHVAFYPDRVDAIEEQLAALNAPSVIAGRTQIASGPAGFGNQLEMLSMLISCRRLV